MAVSGRPARLQRTVEVPRRVLGVLVGVLAACLLLLAFAIGRESGRRAERREAPERVHAQAPAAEPAPEPPRPLARPDRAPPPPPPRAPISEPDAPVARSSPTPAEVWSPAPTPDPQRAAVVRYFADLDEVEAQVSYRGDPQQLAMSLLGQTASGDTSGFDDLIASQRTAQHSILAISAPQPCAEHHRRTLTLLGESLAMLEEVKRGIASQDLMALTGVVERARGLESQARQLEAMGVELRQRFAVD